MLEENQNGQNESFLESHQFIDETESNLNNVEGECRVLEIRYLKQSTFQTILSLFLTLLTFGIFFLVCTWDKKLMAWAFYNRTKNLIVCTHILVRNSDSQYQIVRKRRSLCIDSYEFTNRFMQYEIQYSDDVFTPVEYQIENMTNRDIKLLSKKGLKSNQVLENRETYGQCLIQFPLPNICSYLFREMTKPLNLMQYLGFLIWILEKYFIFAINLFVASIFITIVLFFFVRAGRKRLLKNAQNIQQLLCLRDSKFVEIDSNELVPGDVFQITGEMHIPCDCVLIRGQSLMNESSLTGESVPVAQFQIEPNSNLFQYSLNSTNLLYEGTNVINVHCQQTFPKNQSSKLSQPNSVGQSHRVASSVSEDEEKQLMEKQISFNHQEQLGDSMVLALAVRTGFSSFKGQIIRSLLFPQIFQVNYLLQGIKFCMIEAIFNLALAAILIPQSHNRGASLLQIFLFTGEGILNACPPTLPIFLSICSFVALIRLKSQQIIGIDPNRLILAGKINTVCFDKTGTITQNQIEVHGHEDDRGNVFQNGIDKSSFLAQIFAVCHQAQKINENVVGDPVDIQMLQYSGWDILKPEENEEGEEQSIISVSFDPENPKRKLCVLKIFEFKSGLQSMSVIVLDQQTGQYYLFMKGSPEKLKTLCKKSSISPDFNKQTQFYALSGFRIIGLAYQQLSQEQIKIDQRSKLEFELTYAGLLVMVNNLKQQSADVISNLSQSNHFVKIISGDTPLTVISTGFKCGMLDSEQSVIIITADLVKDLFELRIDILENSTLNGHPINESTIFQRIRWILTSLQSPDSMQWAVTGNALDVLYIMLSQKLSQQEFSQFCKSPHAINRVELSLDLSYDNEVSTGLIQDTIRILLFKTQIFARARPEQQAMIVKQLKNLDQRLMVCMVGDGANDCAAIRQADLGISFSETDAAFSAPFSSLNLTLDCVEKILMEGRTSLSNTNQIFRYIIGINEAKYIIMLFLTYFLSNYNDVELTWIMYAFGGLIMAFSWCFSQPSEKLVSERQDTSLFGATMFISVYGKTILVFGGCMTLSFMLQAEKDEGWYIPKEKVDDDGRFFTKGVENTLFFYMLSIFMPIFVFSIYMQFATKQSMIKNYFLCLIVFCNIVLNSLMIFLPSDFPKGLKLDTTIPDQFQFKTVIVAWSFSLMFIIFDQIVSQYILLQQYQRVFQRKLSQMIDQIINTTES